MFYLPSELELHVAVFLPHLLDVRIVVGLQVKVPRSDGEHDHDDLVRVPLAVLVLRSSSEPLSGAVPHVELFRLVGELRVPVAAHEIGVVQDSASNVLHVLKGVKKVAHGHDLRVSRFSLGVFLLHANDVAAKVTLVLYGKTERAKL